MSKRDRDLDMGALRQNTTPERIIGSLAFSAGLIDRNTSISLDELLPEFSWNKLKTGDIRLEGVI